MSRLSASVRLSAQARKGVMPMPPASQIWRAPPLRKSNRPYGPSTCTRVPVRKVAGRLRVQPPSARMENVRAPSGRGALAIVKGCGSDSPASGARTKANCPGRHRMARPMGLSVSVVVSPVWLISLTVNSRRRSCGATSSVKIHAATPAMPNVLRSIESDGSTPVGMSTKNW